MNWQKHENKLFNGKELINLIMLQKFSFAISVLKKKFLLPATDPWWYLRCWLFPVDKEGSLAVIDQEDEIKIIIE